MPPPSSSSSFSSWVGFFGEGFGATAFLMAACPFLLDAFLRGRSSSSSTSPGAVNGVPHLGHLTLLPSGTGLEGLKTDLQSGQVIRVDAMIIRPDRFAPRG